MNNVNKNSLWPLVAFWVLGLIWGSNFIFMKWALKYITPFQIVFFRLLLGFIPVLIYTLLTKQLKRSHFKHVLHFLVMANLAAAVYYYLFVKGTGLLASGIAGAVSGAIPLFAFVLSVIFIAEEKLTFRKALGVMLGIGGVLLVARPFESQVSTGTGAGVLYLALGSLSLGASFVYARKFLTPLNISSGALTTYQLGLASFIMLLITDFTGVDQILNDGYALWGLVVGLGLLGTGLAFILYYFIVAQLGATTASSASYLPPVVALIIGALLVGEPIALLDWLATGLIFAGVILLRKRD